jgi:hypothetical protein
MLWTLGCGSILCFILISRCVFGAVCPQNFRFCFEGATLISPSQRSFWNIGRVELPITDHYLMTEHYSRSLSSMLHFEWFKMLEECYLKLYKSSLKCKGKGIMKK